MKCELILEQSDYIMAGKIMSLFDGKARCTRRINVALTLIFLMIGIALLAVNYQNKLVIALIWGICSLFLVITIAGFRRWNKKNVKNTVGVNPLQVTYVFSENGLLCQTKDQKTELSWSQLHRFGEKDGYLFMIFDKQQVVVMEERKLSRSQIKEIEAIIQNRKIKK